MCRTGSTRSHDPRSGSTQRSGGAETSGVVLGIQVDLAADESQRQTGESRTVSLPPRRIERSPQFASAPSLLRVDRLLRVLRSQAVTLCAASRTAALDAV